jgi:hypothetical protein
MANPALEIARRIRRWLHSRPPEGARKIRCRALRKAGRAPRKERILMVAWFDPRGLNTIAENIAMIGRLSKFRFDLLNLWGKVYDRGLEFPRRLKLSKYDAIFIHCTCSYNPDNLVSLDAVSDQKIADFAGLKIMMKQDENFHTDRTVDYLVGRGFKLVLTCVPSESVRKVYSVEKLPDARFLHTITGYVSDDMRRLTYSQRDNRPIDIGYRGSLQPYFFGRLCDEKRTIGEVFTKICAQRGLSCDISSRWEDRFPGRAWLDFLGGRIKGVLGVESGASIFDFDGRLERECAEYLKGHPDAGFDEVFAKFLAPHEGNVYYNQVSPRHFEAAACRTVQILYAGKYSGIFQAGRHYLSLNRDLSNLDEVLARFGDPAERIRLTEAAFDEIIMNDRYHYSSFIRDLDAAIEPLL